MVVAMVLMKAAVYNANQELVGLLKIQGLACALVKNSVLVLMNAI